MSVLERVLICPRWDQFYKRVLCESTTRVGSYHCPLVVNIDDHKFKQQHSFSFEMAWLTQEGFRESLMANLPNRGGKNIQDH
jgi:hypothetical protein